MKNKCTRELTGNVILIKKEDFDDPTMSEQTLKINIPDGSVMITREEYNKALDIVEKYHKQLFNEKYINSITKL